MELHLELEVCDRRRWVAELVDGEGGHVRLATVSRYVLCAIVRQERVARWDVRIIMFARFFKVWEG